MISSNGIKYLDVPHHGFMLLGYENTGQSPWAVGLTWMACLVPFTCAHIEQALDLSRPFDIIWLLGGVTLGNLLPGPHPNSANTFANHQLDRLKHPIKLTLMLTLILLGRPDDSHSSNLMCISFIAMVRYIYTCVHLLPTGSEEREVLEVRSIPVAILPSCQYMNSIALQFHKHEYSWEVKIRIPSEAVLKSRYSPWLNGN